MDLKQLREIMKREGAKAIIVEDGEPILIVSLPEEGKKQMSFQSSPVFKKERDKEEEMEGEEKGEKITPLPLAESGSDKKDREKVVLEKAVESREITQGTELLTKEELPSDELTIEDLPF